MELKFVSYDGAWPNLCSGTLILSLDGREIQFPDYCIASGGSCTKSCRIKKGEWSITKYPEDFPEELKDRAIELVNENVPHGCCGGCI